MKLDKFNQFKNLHTNGRALVLINIWDAASAAIVQSCGSPALATSSASLAWANGYADGSMLPKDLLLDAVTRIMKVCEVPLTVDIEDGYSESPEKVAELASDLVSKGISGINIEDGNGSPELLAEKISAIRSLPGMKRLFINARTDVYLRQLAEPPQRLTESIARLKKYVDAGADGVFVPGLDTSEDVSVFSSSVHAPLNVMVPPNADHQELVDAGAARISLGPATFIDAYSSLLMISGTFLKKEASHSLSYDYLNEILME